MHKGRLRNMTSVFLTDAEGILCLYRIGSRVANEMYVGSAGGHFEETEVNDAKKCALREMKEELGLTEADVVDMKLRYVTLRYRNGEIRQNYYFFASLPERIPLASTEGVLTWFSYEQAEKLRMPVSAKHMMLHYLNHGRYDDRVYAGVTEPGGSRFVPLIEFDD